MKVLSYRATANVIGSDFSFEAGQVISGNDYKKLNERQQKKFKMIEYNPVIEDQIDAPDVDVEPTEDDREKEDPVIQDEAPSGALTTQTGGTTSDENKSKAKRGKK